MFKKAHELSVLCSVDVAVFIFGNNKKLYEYSSTDMNELIRRYTVVCAPPRHCVLTKANRHSTVASTSTRGRLTLTVATTRKRTRRVMSRPRAALKRSTLR